jgi:hypothetical protein
MIISAPTPLTVEPAPEGHPISYANGKNKERRDQIDDRVPNIRGMLYCS